MGRRILIAIITTWLQTVLYYLVFSVGWELGKVFHEPTPMTPSEAIGFAAFLKFSIILFAIAMLVMNVLDAVLNQKTWTWRLLVALTIFYLIYWGWDISYLPFKTILFLITGMIAIFSRFPIKSLLDKLIRKRTGPNARR